MAKRNSTRKPSGAAAITTVDDDFDQDEVEMKHEEDGSNLSNTAAPKRATKAKADQPSDGSFGVVDIKKAVAFVNSVGHLDKAMTLLQVVKVAKEVQSSARMPTE